MVKKVSDNSNSLTPTAVDKNKLALTDHRTQTLNNRRWITLVMNNKTINLNPANPCSKTSAGDTPPREPRQRHPRALEVLHAHLVHSLTQPDRPAAGAAHPAPGVDQQPPVHP